MRKIVLPLCGLAVLTCGFVKDPIVAKVGDFVIRKQDIEYRTRYLKQSGNEESPKLALYQLERAYTYAQIMKNNGRALTEESLAREEERIEKNTRMPKKLAEIKQIFGKNKEAYRRVFILPVLAERSIYYDFFQWNPKLQAPSAKPAEVFLKKALARPKAFESVAKAENRNIIKFAVGLHEGVQFERPKSPDRELPGMAKSPNEIQNAMAEQSRRQTSAEGAHWIKSIVRPLKEGAVHSKVVEQPESWLVVRYLGRDPKKKDTYRMEGVAFPKEDYGRWMEIEKRKVDISRTEEAEKIGRG